LLRIFNRPKFHKPPGFRGLWGVFVFGICFIFAHAYARADSLVTESFVRGAVQSIVLALNEKADASDLANYVHTSSVGMPGGIAILDESGLVPLEMIPDGIGGVQSDWNAESGPAQILNRPALGTAAAMNIADFASAAQGALADTAVQPAALASFIAASLMGAPNGVATLDSTGRLTIAQLPDVGGNLFELITRTDALEAGKADRAAGATAGNLAGLNAGGHPTDSGISAANVIVAIAQAATALQEIPLEVATREWVLMQGFTTGGGDDGGGVTNEQLQALMTAIQSHSDARNNPHQTTAAQVGAIPTAARGAADGVASLDTNARIPFVQMPVGMVPGTVAAGNDPRFGTVSHGAPTGNPTPGTVFIWFE